MREELQLLLEQEFPFMARRKIYEQQMRDGRISDLYGAFGCEIGDGWYNLIKGLCVDIVQVYEEEGKPIDLKPMQVKEKFATLRFYYCFESETPGICAIDFMGAMA